MYNIYIYLYDDCWYCLYVICGICICICIYDRDNVKLKIFKDFCKRYYGF